MTIHPNPPAPPPAPCSAKLDALQIDKFDDGDWAYAPTFTPATFPVIHRTSYFRTRVRGEDTTNWRDSNQYWGKNDAVSMRALRGTDTLAMPQTLKVIYQLKDAQGNTMFNSLSSNQRPRISWPGIDSEVPSQTHKVCDPPDYTTGIGQCNKLVTPQSLFDTSQTIPLTLTFPGPSGTVTLTDFATVTLQQRPQWSRDGGWNGGESGPRTVTQHVAYGVVLPYEDRYVPAGSNRVNVDVQIWAKTHMAGADAAQRMLSVGKFKVVYLSAGCNLNNGNVYRNSNFPTWDVVPAGAGEFVLSFSNSAGGVSGHSVHLATIRLRCLAGTHLVGVETQSHSDANGVTSRADGSSADPNTIYATSVGHSSGGGYVQRAAVYIKTETQHISGFAYPSDGRANLNNLGMIGQSPPTLTMRFDTIGNSPYASRMVNQAGACTSSSLPPTLSGCTYTAATSDTGAVTMGVSLSTASDSLALNVVRPTTIVLQADDTTLEAIHCNNADAGAGAIGSAGRYQSTRLRLWVDDLDMTHMSTYTSSDTSVATVSGSDVICGCRHRDDLGARRQRDGRHHGQQCRREAAADRARCDGVHQRDDDYSDLRQRGRPWLSIRLRELLKRRLAHAWRERSVCCGGGGG